MSDPERESAPDSTPEGEANSATEAGSLAIPREGRLAGIDFGTVRIGIAVSDPGQILASPLENYTRQDDPRDAQHFRELVAEEAIAGFIVGLPIYPSGDESPKSAEARVFGSWLTKQTGLPVAYQDERYTSADAEDQMISANLTRKRRKKRLDMMAAQIILRSYLERPRA